jgi:E3 ubiquitin-protein ligase FANCL
MKELDKIGWSRIVHVNEDFSTIQIRAHGRSGYEHTFEIIINPGYPRIAPVVHASLPSPVVLSWSFPRSDLSAVVQAVEHEIAKNEDIFKVLSSIDDDMVVLEPSPATFAVSYRRVAIERSCSVTLQLNPNSPHGICEMKFFGPPARTNVFRTLVGQNIHNWVADASIRENLENVLGMSLPRKEGKADGQSSSRSSSEPLVEECGICYTYAVPLDVDIGGSSSGTGTAGAEQNNSHRSAIPDQVCPNPKCCKNYHCSCLIDWLQALPNSKTSFGTLFGSCPYCQEPLSVRL